MSKFFEVNHRSNKSKARRGQINTPHGTIQTPAFVPVATKGTVKGLTPQHVKDIGMQIAFVNTYHLVTHPGVEVLEQAGKIHTFSKLPIPLMSDSGGFQVFSLAVNNKRMANIRGEEEPMVQKIHENGVIFRSVYDGSLIEFTPEKSIEYQKKIGADIIMAFDECTYHPATHEYAKKAMDRTHEWLKRCVTAMEGCSNQFLYGIIQGARFEDLRKASAEFVISQPTPGVAIGGVSVGETKEEMRQQVGWVTPYLPADRPVHLLGVGQLDDLYDLITSGIDTFDCVEPTRIARVGIVYQWNQIQELLQTFETHKRRKIAVGVDITKGIFKTDLSPVDTACTCYTCSNFTKAYLYHLFKQKELLGYTLATYHNLFLMERFMEELRKMIENDMI
jgi:queuine tRNA-ribosyltransferase